MRLTGTAPDECVAQHTHAYPVVHTTHLRVYHTCTCTPQAVIGNYAVPILEDKSVWGTNDETRTAYLDSQDVARMALAALR